MHFECTTSKIFHPFLLTLLLDVLFLVQLKNSAQFKLHALPLSFVLMHSCSYQYYDGLSEDFICEDNIELYCHIIANAIEKG